MGQKDSPYFHSLRSAAIIALVVIAATANSSADPATEPATQPAPSAPPAPPTYVLNAGLSALVVQSNDQHTYAETAVVGGAFAKNPFSDVSPDGVLIGLRIGLGKFFDNQVVKQIQPIYLTPRGEEFGHAFGDPSKVFEYVDARAPRGSVVGSLDIRGGGGLDGITVKYLPYTRLGLNSFDEMTTRRIGMTGAASKTVGGDGAPIIGICGCIDDNQDWLGLGLIYVTPPALINGH
jgi:hypothetical protein